MKLKEFSNPVIPLEEIQDFYSIQPNINKRPFTWSNSLTTVDGVLHFLESSKTVGQIGLHHIDTIKEQECDWRLLNGSRAYADAVLVTGQILRDEADVDCSIKYNDLIQFRRERGKSDHPIQCILSQSGDFPIDRPMFDKDLKVWIFVSKEARLKLEPLVKHVKATVRFFTLDNGIPQLLDILYKNGVEYLDVSTGGKVIRSFIDLKLLDEVRMTMAGQLIGFENSKGEKRPLLHPVQGKSYTPENAPLIKWKGIRTCGDYFVFYRGVLQYRH